jgi:hypothetical protein
MVIESLSIIRHNNDHNNGKQCLSDSNKEFISGVSNPLYGGQEETGINTGQNPFRLITCSLHIFGVLEDE